MNEEEQAPAALVPAHTRVTQLRFDENKPVLHVTLEDIADEYVVAASNITALYAAQIRFDGPTPPDVAGKNIVETILTASTWPRSLRPHTFLASSPAEELHTVLALRKVDIGPLWYFVADSFNFRGSLGDEAGYLTERNLQALVHRLAGFAPYAIQDAGFAALVAHTPLPAPLSSLIEFFRASARN